MARALLAAALLLTACDRQPAARSGSSVTVKLPPPVPATAEPGFSASPKPRKA